MRHYGNEGSRGWADAAWANQPATLAEQVKEMDAQGLADHSDGNVSVLLKCIEKEIDDETLRLDKEEPEKPGNGWEVSHEKGTGVWEMNRVWQDERHRIRVRLTQRDTSLDPECDVRGEHCPFDLVIETQKGGGHVMEFAMDVIEGECVVDYLKARPLKEDIIPPIGTSAGTFARELQYPGPNLDEAEEEVLDGIQAFLAARNIDDQLAEFIGQQSIWFEQIEYERWLEELKKFLSA